ncbi:hypothetical protein OKJ48_22445 [Streptomyces kunmingensis]|uniref:Uncharacterized protein n=1 Tax=Streptomyces kunmingensis TaxID=68225 RepID=A0ABU6CG36_9ACTN|nr:hypothetical protein [Streptomyces kunmingensis]MEB3962986.1 hypothetical protein [Streptomyces kunmingensis]
MTTPQETAPGLIRAVAEWLHINGIDPADVPVDSDISIDRKTLSGTRHIRYSALLRNELGHLYHDPITGRPAVEDRTAVLTVAPPLGFSWLSNGASNLRIPHGSSSGTALDVPQQDHVPPDPA